MKTKNIVIIIAGIGVAAVLLVIAARLHTRAAAHSRVNPAVKASAEIANDKFKTDGQNNEFCIIGVDPDTRRTTDSEPAMHVKCSIAPDSPEAAKFLVRPDSINQKLDNCGSSLYYIPDGSPFMGQHIRVRGWLKTKDVASWASVFVIIQEIDGHWFAVDDMSARPIRGTADWQQVEVITDTPDKPCVVYFGPDLYGTGELWADGFQIELAPPSAAITDDRSWHIRNQTLDAYSETADFANMHDGHSSICIAYVPEGEAPRGTRVWWGQNIRTPDQYRGHTVSVSGWIKTENVSGYLEPSLQPQLQNRKVLAKATMPRGTRLVGTHDWTKFSITCTIPKETQRIDNGFNFYGNGKVWIDKESLKYEISK